MELTLKMNYIALPRFFLLPIEKGLQNMNSNFKMQLIMT
jgi:hypothetical protein